MAYLTLRMLVVLPPYLAAHLFFQRFQQMKIGVACKSVLCAAFLGLTAHHCRINACSEEQSGSMPAMAARLLQTAAANFPLPRIWSMESIPDLSKQQTQAAGWMPRLVILSLVGSLPLRALHNKKEDLKGMFLCHRRELKWFLTLFSLISSKADEQLKPPCVLGFQTAWSGNCWRGEMYVASMLESWLAGACSNSLLKLHLPLPKNLQLWSYWVYCCLR